MTNPADEREWMAGYDAARGLCLRRGSEHAHLQRSPTWSRAYEAGYDWGVWDYEDANGLPHREAGT